MFVGSFGGDFNGFQHDVVAAVTQFKAAGVTHLLIDLTDNGGMDTLSRQLSSHSNDVQVDLFAWDNSCTNI